MATPLPLEDKICLKVAEHTWGVDVKSTIADYINWDNAKFHALLEEGAPNFAEAVGSWQRQAKYVDWALEALGLTPQVRTNQLWRTARRPQQHCMLWTLPVALSQP